MSYGYTYTFPALRGIQAGKEYYVAMCPLTLLPKIFVFDEAPIPPELRAQRTLNVARIPEITRYIVNNRHNYAFSAITASIDGEVRFEPANMGDRAFDVGLLIVPMSAHFVIHDGQHRRAAIEAALKEQPDLEDETIAVVLYVDAGLRRSQQLFADLNRHAVRPTQSLGILYDYRDPLATLSRKLAEDVFYFKGLTELEKTSISNRSVKLFTLSGIYQATEALLGTRKNTSINEKEQELAFLFWTELGHVIPEWQLAANRKVSSAELRSDYVHAHSIVLHALGVAGNALLRQHSEDWQRCLSPLRDIDWLRSNTLLWEGRAMIGGQMSKTRQNVQLTANLLKTTLGLELSSEEAKLEEKYQSGISIRQSYKEVQTKSKK
jgi:DNA sulfur modification protein DndB